MFRHITVRQFQGKLNDVNYCRLKKITRFNMDYLNYS